MCALAACAAPEVLTPYVAAVPPDIDLSGNWLLNEDESENFSRALRNVSLEPDELQAAMQRGTRQRSTAGSETGSQSRVRSRPPSTKDRGLGGMMHYFLRFADELSVSQTPTALFINFNRAVVREYRFGEQRELNRSNLIVQRVSGWDADNDHYVIKTLHPKGSMITERYYLAEGGESLHRQVLLRGRANELVTFAQVFDRKPLRRK